MTTPDQAQAAVRRVLSEVPREHEAAYRVIREAVHICLEAGMERHIAAIFLGIPRRRIDRRGQYFRSLWATRKLFRSAFDVSNAAWGREDSVDAIVRRAWRR